MNCIELLERFIENNGINKDNMKFVADRIAEFNGVNEDRCNVEYSNAVITAIIVDSFKMNGENLKMITDYCIKKGLQIGRRHKKVLLRYLDYRNESDLELFFKELSVENEIIDREDIIKKVKSISIIEYDVAAECFLKLWEVAIAEEDIKKLSDYLFGIYSKLHAYYNKNEMSNVALFKYNEPFIDGDLGETSIMELKEFCDNMDPEEIFYDKYVKLLRKELQDMSLKGELEVSMNQPVVDNKMINQDKIFDRKGDLHYLLTEDYDAVYLRLNQTIYDKFDSDKDFFNYVLDAIQQAFRILVNNKVFAVEIDNIYSGNRNIKWLLYGYIGVYGERFIRTEEKRKFYSAEKICNEMFRAYGITYELEKSDEIEKNIKQFYRGKNENEVIKAANNLYELTKHAMDREQFMKYMDEWRYVYYGFSFNDCFVIKGISDSHEQFAAEVKNDNKLLFIFYKYRMDERKTPCPVCNGLNALGNSYSEIGHRSWECKNVICKSRSKSNRGKRYSFKTNYMQAGARNVEIENVITKDMIAKWRKDIAFINSTNEVYEMFIKYFSFPEEKVLFINGDDTVISRLNDYGRTLVNTSLCGQDSWYTTDMPEINIDNNLFSDYFEDGTYIRRFVRTKEDSVPKKEVLKKLLVESDAYIINGDSFDILNSLEPGSVAAAVTSPPYFNAREYSQWENLYLYFIDMYNIARKTLQTLDKSGIFLYNIGDVNGNEMTIAKSNMGTKRLLLGAYSILIFEKAGYELVDDYIWNKGEPQSKRSANDGNFTPHYQKPVNCYEHMFIFKRRNDELRVNTDNIPEAWKNYVVDFMPVYKINCKGENTVGHTAPYPEDIPDFVSKVFGKPGKYILDPFLGSGTSIVSAVRNGYKGVGIEFSEGYAELAKERFENDLPEKKVELVK